MPYKYKTSLQKINGQPCPCMKTFKQKTLIAFRFLNNPGTAASFIPFGIDKGHRDDYICEHYALSFYDTLENARKKFQILNKRGDAKSRLGDHIAEVQINPKDGICCPPEEKNYGHLALHEYTGADLAKSILQYFKI